MLPCHHPVNAPPSHIEGTVFNGSFRQIVSPSTLPGSFHSAQACSSQADCKSAHGQKAGRIRSRLCSLTSCLPRNQCTDILTVLGKCVWSMRWFTLMQIGWGTLLDFVGQKQQLKNCQSGRNEKGPGRENKSLPWHGGVREPMKSYREQGQQQSDRLREHYFCYPVLIMIWNEPEQEI